MRIMEEGLSWEVYDPIGAISLWWEDASRRVTEERGPRKYKKRATKRKLLASLSDSSESENDFE